MSDFLLELRCEEIPARMQAGARAELERLFLNEMYDASVELGEATVWSTPRRLALIARGLPEVTEDFHKEFKGPKVGAPRQAIEGFLRKVGLTEDFLEERDGIYFAVIAHRGRQVRDLLAEAVPAIVRAFPWPKSMRWGEASIATESTRWVRPLSGVVAIFGGQLVECAVADIASGCMTLGHRFHHPGPITIGGADDYQEKLRACHVIVDHAERQDLIRAGAAKVAADAGLTLVEDEGLVIENAGLTEYPVPLLGRFDPAFLDVPPEVIQLTARVNQKYFVCEKDGQLADAFVCTANIDSSDAAAIVDGNRKVLAARLSDARFFWDQDRKTPLAEHAKKLENIVFHEKLGTVNYRIERTIGLAIWLSSKNYLAGFNESEIRQAALLGKADLVSGTVGEFPELQALIGSRIAEAQGAPQSVVVAIHDQYRPVGPSDDVPREPLAVALALCDKLQTICAFFLEGLVPTGSSDPFALRRTSLGIIRIILENNLRIPLREVIGVEMLAPYFARVRIFAENEKVEAEAVLSLIREFLRDEDAASLKIRDAKFSELLESIIPQARVAEAAVQRLLAFFADRLKVQQREAGVRHDLIDAVFALGGEDDLVRLLARVHALQSFIGTEDGANLLAGYKRAANILKKEDWPSQPVSSDPSFVTPAEAGVHRADSAEGAMDSGLRRNDEGREPAEQSLIDALDVAESTAASAIEAEDFEAAMRALASLRAPIDRFFDEVTVNDENPDKRAARLDLLARFRAAVHNVADFSRIEG